jgi:hypothetical protein
MRLLVTRQVHRRVAHQRIERAPGGEKGVDEARTLACEPRSIGIT